jgi:eukaryotic translation initiation factor 2C
LPTYGKSPNIICCILAETFGSLKFNFKIGGVNHILQHNSIGVKDSTMLVGADVTHAGKGKDPGCPSIVGIVSTIGVTYGNYLASARLQSNNTEVSKS